MTPEREAEIAIHLKHFKSAQFADRVEAIKSDALMDWMRAVTRAMTITPGLEFEGMRDVEDALERYCSAEAQAKADVCF